MTLGCISVSLMCCSHAIYSVNAKDIWWAKQDRYFDDAQAVDTSVRVLKEGGMDAIKLEGGSPSRITAAKAIVEAGIAVMGHVGLTPQAISVLGGFRPQGRNVCSAVKVLCITLF